jgi:hypothetical protein
MTIRRIVRATAISDEQKCFGNAGVSVHDGFASDNPGRKIFA